MTKDADRYKVNLKIHRKDHETKVRNFFEEKIINLPNFSIKLVLSFCHTTSTYAVTSRLFDKPNYKRILFNLKH